MKQPWPVLAARVQAEHPHWSWSQVCAEVASRRPRKRTAPKPTPQQFAARLEQLGLF